VEVFEVPCKHTKMTLKKNKKTVWLYVLSLFKTQNLPKIIAVLYCGVKNPTMELSVKMTERRFCTPQASATRCAHCPVLLSEHTILFEQNVRTAKYNIKITCMLVCQERHREVKVGIHCRVSRGSLDESDSAVGQEQEPKVTKQKTIIYEEDTRLLHILLFF